MNRVEEKLAASHGRREALLIGSATMGLMLGLQALGIRNQWVAVPNNVCFSVIQAILYSGNSPLYLDIDEDDQGLSPEELDKADGYAAVVAVHAYGQMCKISAISAICNRKGVPLIEDVAVAQGARGKLLPAGAFGYLSVLSFGSGKIIDIEHGGAVMADDPSLLQEISTLSSGFSYPDKHMEAGMDKISRMHTRMYNEEYISTGQVRSDRFVRTLQASKEYYLIAFDRAHLSRLAMELNRLEQNLEERRERAVRFYEAFSNRDGIVPLLHKEGDVYWRFNLLIEHGRNQILRELLADGLPISSWHPSADVFFRQRQSEDLATPVSDRISGQILNLWVNSAVDSAYERTVTDKILMKLDTILA